MGKSKWYDMREFLNFLEKQNDVLHIKEEVDPDWEVNGISRVSLQEFGPCLFFEKIKGADYPLVANLITTDNRFLWSLGIEKWSDFNDEWMRRAEKLIPPVIVKNAPCQEETIAEKDIDLEQNMQREVAPTGPEAFSGDLIHLNHEGPGYGSA